MFENASLKRRSAILSGLQILNCGIIFCIRCIKSTWYTQMRRWIIKLSWTFGDSIAICWQYKYETRETSDVCRKLRSTRHVTQTLSPLLKHPVLLGHQRAQCWKINKTFYEVSTADDVHCELNIYLNVCMRDPDFVTTIEAPGVARASAGTMLKNK